MDGFMVHCCKCDSGFEIDPDAVTCPKCATENGGTQPTDAQQLKAEIALLLNTWDNTTKQQFLDTWVLRIMKLRQLSAV
jgi:hypothetical protein